MPLLTRWLVKTSFVYLGLALLAGLLLAVQSLFNSSILGGLFPVYIHLLVFGWITQLIFGVVNWMFPVYSKEKPRAHESLGWGMYILLNTGLLLRGVAEPVHAAAPNVIAAWTLVLSAVLQLLAGVAFVVNSWGRVRER